MDRIQLRRDSSKNWKKYNPVLMEGEVGYETDTRKRKIGDGHTAWNDLEYLVAENIAQELGDGENIVISQKVMTELIDEGYLYKGIADTTTNITEPAGKIFYIVTSPGTYIGFNNIVIDGGLNIVKWNGTSWVKDKISLDVTKEQIDAIDQKISDLNSNTGISEYEQFNTSKAYAVGDVVSYNNKLYKFIVPHSAGAFDEGQVEETSLKGELKELSILSKLIAGINISPIKMTIQGYYSKELKGELSEDTGRSCEIPVIKNNTYLICTAINKNVVFVDINENGTKVINKSFSNSYEDIAKFRWYKIQAGENKLGFTLLDVDGYKTQPLIIDVSNIDNGDSVYHELEHLYSRFLNYKSVQIDEIDTTELQDEELPKNITLNINVNKGAVYYVKVFLPDFNYRYNFYTDSEDEITPNNNEWTKFIANSDGNTNTYIHKDAIKGKVKFICVSEGTKNIYDYIDNSKSELTNEKNKEIGINCKLEGVKETNNYPTNLIYNTFKVQKNVLYKVRLVSGAGGNLYIDTSEVITDSLTSEWTYFISSFDGYLKTYIRTETSNIIELVQLDSLWYNAHGGIQLNRFFFENAGAKQIQLSEFKEGYYNGNGTLKNDNAKLFKHINIETVPNKIYAVLTRMSANMTFVNLTSIDDVEYNTIAGTVIDFGWNANMSSTNEPAWQLRFIKPTSQYLGISLWKESAIDNSENEVVCYELNGGWLYDVITGNNLDSVTKKDLKGILPQEFVSYGNYDVADGFITTQGICTNYNTKMTENRLLKSVKFYANKAGKIRFAVGTIDQRNWAIIQQEFEVECNAGENEVDILDLGIISPRDGYLFAYNNYYGDGCSIGYKLRDEASSSYYYYSDDTLSALHALDISIAPNTAYLCLYYKLATDDLMYTRKTDGDNTDYWAESSLSKVAFSIAQKNIIKGDDGKLYKLSIGADGQISATLLSFKKITIFGNSIWEHGALSSGWLSPITDEQGTWSYYEPADNGMSGMWGRGMAATQQEFDFKHLFLRGMQVNNPDVVVQGVNIASVERDLPQDFPSTYDHLLTEDVDVIFWRAGENVGNVSTDYKSALRRYVEHFQERCPKALIILTGRFWKQEKCDRITSDVADEYGLPFIKMYMSEAKFQARNSFVMSYPVKLDSGEDVKTIYSKIGSGSGHPSVLGMYRIANLMLKALSQPTLHLLHNVTIINTVNATYTADDEQIEGAIYTIAFSGNVPNIKVKKKSNGELITTNTLESSVYFIMPNEDVSIELS